MISSLSVFHFAFSINTCTGHTHTLGVCQNITLNYTHNHQVKHHLQALTRKLKWWERTKTKMKRKESENAARHQVHNVYETRGYFINKMLLQFVDLKDSSISTNSRTLPATAVNVVYFLVFWKVLKSSTTYCASIIHCAYLVYTVWVLHFVEPRNCQSIQICVSEMYSLNFFADILVEIKT